MSMEVTFSIKETQLILEYGANNPVEKTAEFLTEMYKKKHDEWILKTLGMSVNELEKALGIPRSFFMMGHKDKNNENDF